MITGYGNFQKDFLRLLPENAKNRHPVQFLTLTFSQL